MSHCRNCKMSNDATPYRKYCGDGSDKNNEHDWVPDATAEERADGLASALARAQADLAKARRHIDVLTAGRILTCAFCAHEYPPETRASNSDILVDHMKVCENHPMRQLEQDLATATKRMTAAELEHTELAMQLAEAKAAVGSAESLAVMMRARPVAYFASLLHPMFDMVQTGKAENYVVTRFAVDATGQDWNLILQKVTGKTPSERAEEQEKRAEHAEAMLEVERDAHQETKDYGLKVIGEIRAEYQGIIDGERKRLELRSARLAATTRTILAFFGGETRLPPILAETVEANRLALT